MTRTKTISDEEVFETARRVFLREGIHTPVAAVAKELGVSVATIFVRAKTKDELIYRALKLPAPVAIDMLNRGPDTGKDLRSQLVEILLSICAFFSEFAPSAFLLGTTGLLQRYEGKRDPSRELRQALARWLRRAKIDGLQFKNLRTVSDLLISALETRFHKAFVRKQHYTLRQNKAFLMLIIDQLIVGSPSA
jgi:AcrR family transcriptional regulator